MSKPVLDQINLVCGDLDASMAFYRKLGVEVPDGRGVFRTQTSGHHASADQSAADAVAFDLDSTAFAQIWNRGWKDRTDLRGRLVLGFRVPEGTDVDAVFANMTAAGYRGLHEPNDAFWGARYAIVEDPDGVAVGVMSPVSPDKKSPPPNV